MFLPTNLKWLRRLKKRTQEDVAFALNIKRSTYSGYENGVGEPSLDKLVLLANYFKITLDGLVAQDLRLMAVSQIPRTDGSIDKSEWKTEVPQTIMRVVREE
ncbi:helix-turn-helix domain-containing protein [Adhaeribacter radiodurans]|uniref:Helix-turn-helix transcriptional regulator n=1 Tax=Adhaeribacter radiodurans TaxID=2745197 RepID=A0A7L7LDQ7_9BACT|nr:helix-turn-helix transcriptional regulator [Adhaeribacter radiodurans]QMU30539.1 helix-turn-helix transcriptional regulator [Adhaeribacter radiodurans]